MLGPKILKPTHQILAKSLAKGICCPLWVYWLVTRQRQWHIFTLLSDGGVEKESEEHYLMEIKTRMVSLHMPYVQKKMILKTLQGN